MSVKNGAVVVLGVAALGIGALTALQPKTPQELEQSRLEQQVQDLGDAQEKVQDDRRAEGDALDQAQQRERSVPGEHRPPEVKGPKIRIRIP